MNNKSSQPLSNIAYDKFGVLGYNETFSKIENELAYLFFSKKKSHLFDFISFLLGLRYTLLKGIFFLKILILIDFIL